MAFRSRRSSRGFTLIELMVVVALSLVGFIALFQLQAGVMRASTNSLNMVQATFLGQHLLETIRMEAMEWTNDGLQGPTQAKFQYFKNVGDAPLAVGQPTAWMRAYAGTGAFQRVNQLGRSLPAGVATQFDAGADVEFPDNRNQVFCVQYRLAWLIVNSLVRVEVRVFWPREGANAQAYDACPIGNGGIETDPMSSWSATFVTTVMKNVFVST